MQIDLKSQKRDQLLPAGGRGKWEGMEGRGYSGLKETFGKIDMFTTPIVVVSRMHTCQTSSCTLYILIHCMYCSYTSLNKGDRKLLECLLLGN